MASAEERPPTDLFCLYDGILVQSSKHSGPREASDLDERSAEGGGEGEASDFPSLVEIDAEREEADADADSGGPPAWRCPGSRPGSDGCDAPGRDPRCCHSRYGATSLAEDEVEARIGPDADGGLMYKLMLLPDDYDDAGSSRGGEERKKKLKILEERNYDRKTRRPKPRRGSPFPIASEDFFGSVVKIVPDQNEEAELCADMWDRDSRHPSGSTAGVGRRDGNDGSPRWFFVGVLNGWPGFADVPLEVMKIQHRDDTFLGRRIGWTTFWDRNRDGKAKNKEPSCKWKDDRHVRVQLRAPRWTSRGYARDAGGFIWWSTGPTVEAPESPIAVTYGTDLLDLFSRGSDGDALNTRASMISHRYSTGGRPERPKEALTYHSIVLLEWDHRKYSTVVEIGYLHGVGGCRGKSNWYDDRDAPAGSRLYAALPPEMILPWKTTVSEIRCHDVPYPDVERFSTFLTRHEGLDKRFVDVRRTFSHVTRLTYRSRKHVATYLLNYIRRDCTYSEMRRNCQTMAADLVGFLAGKKDVQPFHPVNQIQYVPRLHLFLYESDMYGDGARTEHDGGSDDKGVLMVDDIGDFGGSI